MTSPARRVCLQDAMGGRWVKSYMAPSTWDLVVDEPGQPQFVKWTRQDVEAVFGPVIEVDEPVEKAA